MDDQNDQRRVLNLGAIFRLLLNLVTVLVLLATLFVAGAFLVLFINPYMDINPYPPPTLVPTLGSPTPTNTPAKPLPAAWTATPTFTAVPSATPTATQTETPTPAPTLTPEMTPSESEMPFALQVGSPARIENPPDKGGCDFMGAFGQVFDLENTPIIDLTVHLSGELDEVGSIDMWAITGSAPDYGPGGYLFNIADQPIASQDSLWIQLEDGDGNPLSEQVYLETSESCSENLIMVNWRQVR